MFTTIFKWNEMHGDVVKWHPALPLKSSHVCIVVEQQLHDVHLVVHHRRVQQCTLFAFVVDKPCTCFGDCFHNCNRTKLDSQVQSGCLQKDNYYGLLGKHLSGIHVHDIT